MDSTLRSLLQLPFKTYYTREFDNKYYSLPSVILVGMEMILLGIACVQIIRFFHYSNIYLKKLIHMLIACQLIASIALELDIGKVLNVHYRPFILFTIQEATFLFSGLAYLTVFLFWLDFNAKVRSPGPGIKFLQTNAFGFIIFGFAIGYIIAFGALDYWFIDTIEEGWRLSFKVIWWHLAFFCIITPMQLYYSYRIHRSLDKYYLSYSHSLSKTKKILNAVNFCFLFRTCSIVIFVSLYYLSNHKTETQFLSTWPAFICFYILDQILPAATFMFLLRKSPKDHSLGESKLFLSTNSSFGSYSVLSSGNSCQ